MIKAFRFRGAYLLIAILEENGSITSLRAESANVACKSKQRLCKMKQAP